MMCARFPVARAKFRLSAHHSKEWERKYKLVELVNVVVCYSMDSSRKGPAI